MAVLPEVLFWRLPRLCLSGYLLALACWCVAPGPATAQQGSATVLTLSGEGPAESRIAVLRALKLFETRMGVPVRAAYRVTTSAAASASIAAEAGTQTAAQPGALHFAITEKPLSAAARANFTSNPALADSLHLPLFVNVYGLFHGVPGNRAAALNITACLAARILKGDITDWAHPDLLDKNPAFVKPAIESKIVVLADSATSGATVALLDWLAAACPAERVTYAGIRPDAVQVGTGMVGRLQATPFAFGYAMAAAGSDAGVSEMAVEGSAAGRYITSAASNATSMRTALAAAMPTTLTGDYSGVSAAALAAPGVSPLLAVTYLVAKSDWSQQGAAEGQRGEALRALCAFLLGAEVAGTNAKRGFIADDGLLSVGDSLMAAARSALAAALVPHPSAVAYVEADGNGPAVTNSARTDFFSAVYTDVLSQLDTLQRSVDSGGVRVLRGAGSSAVATFMWRCMAELRARSTSPVHMVYRAVGSGAGQSETVAKANKYQALLDFGTSDTPMSDALYTDLTAGAKVQMVHVPIMLAPMNFFVNIPEAALPSRLIKMRPCTIGKIMQADITSWAHADIAADNGFALPDKPITVFYRALSSGTTAVVTEYLKRACADWKLGSGGLLANWPATFKPTANSGNMSVSVATTPWSVGYMDAANGLEVNLIEVAIKNKDGNYVTSQTGDIPAAASALFKSDAWPKSPTQSFSSVSVLDQPGAATFPIVAMPFMFVRTDLTARGDAGALLQAFVAFMLDTATQTGFLPALGFSPLPQEVRQYTVDRALPLLQIDTRARAWAVESGAVLAGGKGSADFVFSSFGGSYENANAQAFADFYKAYNLQKNRLSAAANATNTTAANLSSLAEVPANLKAKLDDLDQRIAILQAVAIAGIVFGIVGVSLAVFATCRMVVHSTIFGSQGGAVHPGNALNLGGSVRRQKSMSAASDASFA